MKDLIYEKTLAAGMALVNVLFPRRCPVCGRIVYPEREMICPSCISRLSVVKQPVCKKCGKEVLSDQIEYCLDCTRHHRTFDSGAALLNYNEAAKHSMAAIKYKNKREYLDFYGAAMVSRFGKLMNLWQADALIPVPIHPSRRRERGFNQAEELAKRLGRGWGIPVDRKLLIRRKKTAPQRELNPSQRLRNLQEAFQINPSYKEEDKEGKVPRCAVLVDDIYTTGSTIEACSRVLKSAGVEEIHFLTVCIGIGR